MNLKRSELLYGLESIMGCIDKRDVVPALQGVLIKDGTMTAYNRVTGAKVVGLDIENFTALIPFEKFYNFIKSVKADEVELNIDGETIKLKSGRASVSLSTMPAEDFPDFSKVFKRIKKDGWEVPEDFFLGIQQCVPFASKDRHEISGVYVEGDIVLASDSKRIARRILTSPVVEGKPIVFSADIVRASKRMGGIEKIYVDEEKAVFQNGDLTMFGSLIAVDFPKVNQYFPESHTLVELPKTELIEGLKRVVNFSDEPNEKKFARVEFGKSLKISYEGETSEIKEYFNFGQTLYDKPFEINPHLFQSVLENCSGFAFITEKFPLLYGQSEDKQFKVLLAIKVVG
jgi:DNA polymerase III sliding clamp (beta) subunit (PCNA family)